MKKRFDKKAIRRGLNVFFGLSIASIALIFIFTDSGATLVALREIEPWFLVIALLLAVVDAFGGGLRMWVLTRGLPRPLSLHASVRASLASIAMGAVTPSQAGGGPAMIFILYRNGLTFAEAMSAGLMSFVVTILFFVVSAGIITFLGVNTSIADPRIQSLFRYGLAIFMVLGMFFILITTWPALLRGMIRGVLNFLSVFRRKHFLRPGARAHALLDVIQDFHDTNLTYFRHRLPALVVSLIITAVIFTAKCFVAFFIVRGLGVSASVWDVVSIQILILLAVYFFPTPGGAGAAELGSAVLMANILPSELLPIFVVLWRVIVMYLAVVVGAVVMMQELGQDTLITGRPGDIIVEKKVAVSSE